MLCRCFALPLLIFFFGPPDNRIIERETNQHYYAKKMFSKDKSKMKQKLSMLERALGVQSKPANATETVIFLLKLAKPK